jgi:hypothetical protein
VASASNSRIVTTRRTADGELEQRRRDGRDEEHADGAEDRRALVLVVVAAQQAPAQKKAIWARWVMTPASVAATVMMSVSRFFTCATS